MNLPLADKKVLITGAGSGIGRAIALKFAEEGAQLVLWGRRRSALEQIQHQIGGAVISSCDVADRAEISSAYEKLERIYEGIDILVNNAGINTNPRSVADVEPRDWDYTLAVNLSGVFNVTQLVLPHMRSNKNGLIINISSIAGLRASSIAGAAYSASKHGVIALTNSLNDEEMSFGIRSCALCPGEVETPILEQRVETVDNERRSLMLQPNDVADAAAFVARLPTRACVPLLVIKPIVQKFC
ncbi:MAG: SDR family oxidoreductase [Candidatus Latescibacterota bacterium]|nr:SDR family oxidoreductase [Candidatus Latescibacterota bacterium]